MRVSVLGVEYQVKFGFKCLRLLCESYGYKTLGGIDELMRKHNFSSLQDPTFEQLDFIGNLILAGIRSVDEGCSLTSDNILDEVLKGGIDTIGVLNLLLESFPKETEGEGNQ
ncbi:hypothetical protein [Tenacibaculum sp. 190524A02b]|uniref:Uncharacterized protein n=1 Tax=Tenacibaculum vairaonense TaxID=3137860 RepID=A0ABM9PL04_9FLAO